MHRPAFDELMDDVRNGIIKAIVVRDLSRFARNYIEAGTYLERIFPRLDVRFISVKERLDTLNMNGVNESLMIPLQNLINDLYSKDISRKVETALRTQMKEGKFLWRQVPYGYKKNSDNTNIMPHETEAPIVRQMFQWKAEGISHGEIIRRLKQDYPLPSDGTKKVWLTSFLAKIFRNPVYIGVQAVGKTHSAIYKGIKMEKVPKENWYVFPDSHEPLVSKEIFYSVQDIMDAAAKHRQDSMKKTSKSREKMKDLFENKIFCADCGYRIYFIKHHLRRIKPAWVGRYTCSSYLGRPEKNCSSHYMFQEDVEAKVLSAIQAHIKIAIDFEKLIEEFKNSRPGKKIIDGINSAIRKISHRLSAVQNKRKRLYEDYVEGILSESEYAFAKRAYEDEYNELSEKSEELIIRRNSYKEAVSSDNPWIKMMMEIKNAKKLTQKLVDSTIERVLVHDDGNIDIVMKYQDIFERTKMYLSEGRE